MITGLSKQNNVYKEVIEKKDDLTLWEPNENDSIEGKYLSVERNKGKRKNSSIHHMETEKGEIKLWGSKVLDSKLQIVEEESGFGTKIKITYLGKKEPQSGGDAYRVYKVEYDDGQDLPF